MDKQSIVKALTNGELVWKVKVNEDGDVLLGIESPLGFGVAAIVVDKEVAEAMAFQLNAANIHMIGMTLTSAALAEGKENKVIE